MIMSDQDLQEALQEALEASIESKIIEDNRRAQDIDTKIVKHISELETTSSLSLEEEKAQIESLTSLVEEEEKKQESDRKGQVELALSYESMMGPNWIQDGWGFDDEKPLGCIAGGGTSKSKYDLLTPQAKAALERQKKNKNWGKKKK